MSNQPETDEQRKEREVKEKEERKKAVEDAAKKGFGTIYTDKDKYENDKSKGT